MPQAPGATWLPNQPYVPRCRKGDSAKSSCDSGGVYGVVDLTFGWAKLNMKEWILERAKKELGVLFKELERSFVERVERERCWFGGRGRLLIDIRRHIGKSYRSSNRDPEASVKELSMIKEATAEETMSTMGIYEAAIHYKLLDFQQLRETSSSQTEIQLSEEHGLMALTLPQETLGMS
ncbi:hypothetical protein CC78DRAFT_578527 [Lojkania enalia]|uniref:Uncharacterized protein n=1 Tax=Lojkania enalia TaxID=147567 RepID=A0A9P4KGW8_9PLEO|nr:hypothetical protein CC78DRAFT_578527 [Didymosphaeria enalia]